MPLTRTAPDVTTPTRLSPPRPPLALGLLLGMACLVALGHLLVNLFGPYGLHRDAFLYLAMGRHLHFWGMDFPPLIAVVAQTTRHLLGDSLAAIRAVPMIAHALIVLLAGVLAREFGGGRFAQGFAALVVAFATIFLRPGSLFQPVVLDQLWWTLALLALARIGRSAEDGGGTGSPLAWAALGVVAGLGLLTKFSIGFLGVGMLVGLLLSPQRRVLLTRWPWEAALLGLVIGSASIVGQIRLGFPVAGQMADLRSTQLARVDYLEFLLGQLFMLGPIALLLAVAGTLRLLLAPGARGYRVVAWTCLATFLLLLLLHGKAYYLGPIYPTLIAAGAAALELWTAALASHAAGRVGGNVLRGVIVALTILGGVLLLPMGLPILAPALQVQYEARLGLPQETTNRGVPLSLPQDYADMLGWRQQAATVARIFHALTPEQRGQAVVVARNYGEAGALDFYGPRLGLPPAVAPTGSYWFFGPGTKPGNVALTIGWDSATLSRYYQVVHPVAQVRNAWGVPEEQDVPVIVAEHPDHTLQQLWPTWANRN